MKRDFEAAKIHPKAYEGDPISRALSEKWNEMMDIMASRQENETDQEDDQYPDKGRQVLSISIYPDVLEKLDALSLLLKSTDPGVRFTRSSVVSDCIEHVYTLFDKDKFKSRSDLLNKECPMSGDEPGILKKHAWIVWIVDENAHIIDLQVYELDWENLKYRAEKTRDYVERKMYEHKLTYRDTGCVLSDWDQWTIGDLLFKLGCQYGFLTRIIMIKCMERLSYIAEFKAPIEKWLKQVK